MLNGRCVVVTGASGNLGAAVVARLKRDGAKVFGIDHATADVTDEGQVEKAYDKAVAQNGPLWGAVHCTGGWSPGTVADTAVSTFEKMIAVNLRSAFLCSRAAVRRMSSGGRIVNVAALGPATFTEIARSAAYAASKAGVIMLTRAIAEEGGPVRANCVAPGTMRTPQNAAALPGADQSKWVPLEDVAEAIAYLLSPQAGNGAVITF